MEIVNQLIGDENKINNFIKTIIIPVVSFSVNENSSYLWKNYATKDGYCIKFDKNKLVNSFYCVSRNGSIINCEKFKHGMVFYDDNKQIKLIYDEIKGLLELNSDLIEEDKIRYIIRHLMFIGHFYKKRIDCKKEYYKEEEYRVLLNLLNDTVFANTSISKRVPEKYNDNNKDYCEFYFDKSAITEIVCASEKAKQAIENDIQFTNIKIRCK